MVKDHFTREAPVGSKGSYMNHSTDRIVHTTAFTTPVVNRWLVKTKLLNGFVMKNRPIALWTNALPQSYISFQIREETRCRHYMGYSFSE